MGLGPLECRLEHRHGGKKWKGCLPVEYNNGIEEAPHAEGHQALCVLRVKGIVELSNVLILLICLEINRPCAPCVDSDVDAKALCPCDKGRARDQNASTDVIPFHGQSDDFEHNACALGECDDTGFKDPKDAPMVVEILQDFGDGGLQSERHLRKEIWALDPPGNPPGNPDPPFLFPQAPT